MFPAVGLIELCILAAATIVALLVGGFGSWSLIIVSCFAAAMLLTPADPLSMLLLAVPGCFIARWLSVRTRGG